MKSLKSSIFLVFFGVLVGLIGCKNKNVSPNSKIEGTWKIKSVNYKDSTLDKDIWVATNANFSCSKDITITFTTDNIYSVFEPTDCKYSNGESLFLFTSKGTFNLTDNTSLNLIESDATPYIGKVLFENGKFTWTYQEILEGEISSLIILFTKIE